MPYVDQATRDELAKMLRSARGAGELNYNITLLVIEYIYENGFGYQKLNDITGALENCKLEFVRRVVSPYEDKKILENGDVYPKDFRRTSSGQKL